MNLESLLYGLPVINIEHQNPHLKIRKITSDSRNVEKGDLFVACSGTRMDGHDFLNQAIMAGAAAVVYDEELENPLPKSIVSIRVPNSRECLAQLLRKYYGFPDQKMKLIGVTGTNGKTTIAFLLHRILSTEANTAYLGTLGYRVGDKSHPAINTTPGPELLFKLLAEMVEAGTEYCFVEVSSHALEQCRVFGIQFELVIFTQLTQDHLDYHHTMERYYQSKRKLFSASPKPRQMLINRDCVYGRRLLDEFLNARSFSVRGIGDYQARNVVTNLHGSYFDFKFFGEVLPFQIKLPLTHNVSNTVAALGAAHMLGFSPEVFRHELQEFAGVAGRLERVYGSQDFEVFVDYAHTPDAIENVLQEMAELKPKRVLTLFGCGGDRDQEKRPLMTERVVKYSDVVVMTSDNPRSEDPENILRDMKRGISAQSRKNPQIFEVLDRREAIEKIISLAEPGDVVFILGKGHEDYQILGEKKVPFDDRQVVADCLKRKKRVFFS